MPTTNRKRFIRIRMMTLFLVMLNMISMRACGTCSMVSVWLSIRQKIMGVNLAMGGVTPPYASILYLGMRIGKCEFSEIFGPTMKLLVFGYIPVVVKKSVIGRVGRRFAQIQRYLGGIDDRAFKV